MYAKYGKESVRDGGETYVCHASRDLTSHDSDGRWNVLRNAIKPRMCFTRRQCSCALRIVVQVCTQPERYPTQGNEQSSIEPARERERERESKARRTKAAQVFAKAHTRRRTASLVQQLQTHEQHNQGQLVCEISSREVARTTSSVRSTCVLECPMEERTRVRVIHSLEGVKRVPILFHTAGN